MDSKHVATNEVADNYDDFRRKFLLSRGRLLVWLNLIANPMFILADVLLHKDQLEELLIVRALLETILIFCFFLIIHWNRKLLTAIFFLLCIPALAIAHMTVILGGFSSIYFHGFTLYFLCAAVIVPTIWYMHLAAQLTVLAYYYGINLLLYTGASDLTAAWTNSLFIFWSSVCALSAAILFERLQRAEFQGRMNLEKANNKLLELDRLKSEFFSNISHELRTPLTIISGGYQALQKLELSPQNKEAVRSGLCNTRHLLSLINELLDFAKFDSGKLELKKACMDVTSLIRNVAANFESGERRRIHCRGLTKPVIINGDGQQLKKVLTNLLANAFKFSDSQEGQVWLRLGTRNDWIDLEVEDNGIGIPREHFNRIFDRFTQVEGSATRRYEGSGIGLALVKEIVTRHGGHITVESELGRGSTFTLTLPRGDIRNVEFVPSADVETFGDGFDGRDSDPNFPQPTSSLPSQSQDRPLILVVEDHADMRRYFKRILGQQYCLALAKDGVEGLEQIRGAQPDLLITDAMMPRMSGCDLVHSIRKDVVLRVLPVIFVTARVGLQARIECLEAGADDYLSKPFEEDELLVRVSNLLRKRRELQELANLRSETLERFLSPQVAHAIETDNGDSFKSHRREISVAFLDLRGFSTFTETADPEDLLAVLREYHATMGKVCAYYGGAVEHFAGDGMMIFLNDPLPLPNHVEQAVRMAVAMQREMKTLRANWRMRGFDLGLGIGMAVGHATLGVIGFEGRWDYGANGAVVNLAARLCGEAQPEQIVITERLFHHVKSFVDVKPIGPFTLKGFQAPVPAFNVEGLRVT